MRDWKLLKMMIGVFMVPLFMMPLLMAVNVREPTRISFSTHNHEDQLATTTSDDSTSTVSTCSPVDDTKLNEHAEYNVKSLVPGLSTARSVDSTEGESGHSLLYTVMMEDTSLGMGSSVQGTQPMPESSDVETSTANPSESIRTATIRTVTVITEDSGDDDDKATTGSPLHRAKRQLGLLHEIREIERDLVVLEEDIVSRDRGYGGLRGRNHDGGFGGRYIEPDLYDGLGQRGFGHAGGFRHDGFGSGRLRDLVYGRIPRY